MTNLNVDRVYGTSIRVVRTLTSVIPPPLTPMTTYVYVYHIEDIKERDFIDGSGREEIISTVVTVSIPEFG